MDLALHGRRAVVTGGTKGIGRAVVAELLAEGASVAFCARSSDEVKAAEEELLATGDVTVAGWVTDVTDPAAVEHFISAAADKLGGIDILVNNAGAAHPGNFETLSDADWHGDLDVKLFSQIRCTRAALPHPQDAQCHRSFTERATQECQEYVVGRLEAGGARRQTADRTTGQVVRQKIFLLRRKLA